MMNRHQHIAETVFDSIARSKSELVADLFDNPGKEHKRSANFDGVEFDVVENTVGITAALHETLLRWSAQLLKNDKAGGNLGGVKSYDITNQLVVAKSRCSF
jgi:hypothetical protein